MVSIVPQRSKISLRISSVDRLNHNYNLLFQPKLVKELPLMFSVKPPTKTVLQPSGRSRVVGRGA